MFRPVALPRRDTLYSRGVSTADSSGLDPRQIRVGDAERTSALDALGEHMASGRIDLDEYGTRSAQVTQARTVADLQALFRDLPAPHPALPGSAPLPAVAPSSAPVPPPSGSTAVARHDDRTPAQRVAAVASGLGGIAALVLFFVTGSWLWFLLVPAIGIVTSAVWGKGGNR